MKKKKPVAMIAATLVLLLVAGALFVACNKDVGVGSMGVEPYPDKFTNDLDTVDAEDLTAGAQITASSAAETAANVLDGSTETAWTAENTSGQFLEITFSEPVSFNTVVLRENGNYISGFGFVLPDEDGNYPADMKSASFYRQQDRIERYRYCTLVRRDGRGQGAFDRGSGSLRRHREGTGLPRLQLLHSSGSAVHGDGRPPR